MTPQTRRDYIKSEDLISPLFKATLCSVSWVRKLVNSIVTWSLAVSLGYVLMCKTSSLIIPGDNNTP